MGQNRDAYFNLMQLAVQTKPLQGGRTLILHELAFVAYEGTAGLTQMVAAGTRRLLSVGTVRWTLD
jgi:hypothetical protein